MHDTIITLRDETWAEAKAAIEKALADTDFPVWVLVDDSVEICTTSQISEMAIVSGHFVLEESEMAFAIDEAVKIAWDRWFSL